jgi:hypothetical protein
MKAVIIWILELRLKRLSKKRSILHDIIIDAFDRRLERKAQYIKYDLDRIEDKIAAIEAKLSATKGK